MVATLQSTLIGSGISAIAAVSLSLNLFVFFMILYGGFLKSSQSGIYIYALANVGGNALQMALSTFYLGPISIMQDFPFEGKENSFWAKFLSYLFLAQWYEEMFIQIIIAVDRLVTVVFPKYAWIFSRRVKICLAIGVFPAGFALAFLSDYILPCCIAYIYFGDYSYAYIQKGWNYVDHYIDLPLNASSSTIALSCYFIIYLYILNSNRKVAGAMQQSVMDKRKKKEVRYALQFAAISIFVLLAWVNFRVFPLLVPLEIIGMYSLIAVCLICHCSSNAIIFITMNKENWNSRSRSKVHPSGTTGTNFDSQHTADDHSSHIPKQQDPEMLVV